MNTSSYSPSGESLFAKKWTNSQLWTIRVAVLAVGIGVVAGAMVIGSSYLHGESDGAPPTAAPLPVEVVTAEPLQQYIAHRTYTGTLVAARTSTLSFELAGKVVELKVDQGSKVAAGEVLARIDDRHLDARIRQIEAQRAQQAAVLEELTAGPRKQEIAVAEAEVRRLTAELQMQQSTKSRREKLIGQNAISQESLDDATFGTDAAQGQLDAAKSRLDELKEGTRAEQIAAQRAQVAMLDAQLADLKFEQEDTQLVAPYAGTIALRSVDEGTVVTPGQAIYRLVQDEPLEAWFGLPPEVAGEMSTGQVLPIEVENRKLDATVTGIVPELDSATRTQTVVLTLQGEAARGLVPAQVARLLLETKRQSDGFWLPNSALRQGSRGLWSVFVVEEGAQTAPRDVEVLYSESERSFVRGTIVAGEQVVASGINRLVPGMQVEVASVTP